MSTIEHVLHQLFPQRGHEKRPYIGFPADDPAATHAYATPPMLPFDVFAIAGRLLEISGAYHHLAPRHRQAEKRLIHIDPKDLEQTRRVARVWRAMEGIKLMDAKHASAYRRWREGADGQAIQPLFDWWHELFEVHRQVYVVEAAVDAAPPAWWRPALLLFIAADEAAEGVGFNPAVVLSDSHCHDTAPWFERFINLMFLFVGKTLSIDRDGFGETAAISTYSAAEKSAVCVLPKARTPSLGCTMRSLSHNLALMPPQGIATGRWMPYIFTDAPPDERHMNLLLIPFPYEIAASAFRPRIGDVVAGQRCGFFDVHQQWLDDIDAETMTDFIVALAREAEKEVDRIHGVVFPELALDEEIYDALVVNLQSRLPGIEFLVAGVSNVGERRGNFVNVTVFQAQDDQDSKSSDTKSTDVRATVIGFTSKREKHHRWRLDRSQIIGYGLEGVLSPSLFWWEDIDLLTRRVDFSVIRANSVISALICEDLARVDPCQELIRSVGPSIIFALLMDAPQLRGRWPARHATILAEDPGSAVLTMTSKAMMNRQDRLGLFRSEKDEDRVIALWRDDGEPTPREIHCGRNRYGVLLTLSGSRVTDESLDGRLYPAAVAWRYAAQRHLGLGDREKDFAAVLGSDERHFRRASHGHT